jgi:hypothetical protein
LAACIYVATCTRPTVRHVYSDRTRGDLQVAKNNFFCSDTCINLCKGKLIFKPLKTLTPKLLKNVKNILFGECFHNNTLVTCHFFSISKIIKFKL